MSCLVFRQLVSLFKQLVTELTRKVWNEDMLHSYVRFQNAFVLARDSTSRANLRLIFVCHQMAVHELYFLSANLAGFSEIAFVHEPQVLFQARLRSKDFVAVLAWKTGAVFFESFLLLVNLSVGVKTGSRLRGKRTNIANENFSSFFLEFLVSVVRQMNSQLFVRSKSVFFADEAFKLISTQLAKLQMTHQRLLLDETFLTVPTPEA